MAVIITSTIAPIIAVMSVMAIIPLITDWSLVLIMMVLIIITVRINRNRHMAHARLCKAGAVHNRRGIIPHAREFDINTAEIINITLDHRNQIRVLLDWRAHAGNVPMSAVMRTGLRGSGVQTAIYPAGFGVIAAHLARLRIGRTNKRAKREQCGAKGNVFDFHVISPIIIV